MRFQSTNLQIAVYLSTDYYRLYITYENLILNTRSNLFTFANLDKTNYCCFSILLLFISIWNWMLIVYDLVLKILVCIYKVFKITNKIYFNLYIIHLPDCVVLMLICSRMKTWYIRKAFIMLRTNNNSTYFFRPYL